MLILILSKFQAEEAPTSKSYPRLRQRTGQKFVMEEEVAEKMDHGMDRQTDGQTNKQTNKRQTDVG